MTLRLSAVSCPLLSQSSHNCPPLILCGLCLPLPSLPSSLDTMSEYAPAPLSTSRTVFVGNIPYYATEQQVRDILNTVGPLQNLRLVNDAKTGKPKGQHTAQPPHRARTRPRVSLTLPDSLSPRGLLFSCRIRLR